MLAAYKMGHFSDKLFSLPGRGGQTFEAMKRLDAKLGHPHHQFKSIHVGGTNGKGSVTTKIAAVFQNLGYKVGLYTSPHLFSFRERIQINGRMISEAVAEEILAAVYRPELSFFDVLTALAFVYFAREKVDYAVIEVGLGGRFDATNVISPILTVITSIGFDHMAILGNTLEQIAREKRGIVKPGIPLIVGSTAIPFFPEAVRVPSHPFFEMENRLIAKTALAQLGVHSENGLEVRPPRRFEQIGNIIFDVAHNPPAFERLVQALQLHFPGRKFPFYLSFSKDKDWRKCVEIIESYATEIHFIKNSHPRLIPGNFPPKEIHEGVVAGSFYIMSAFLNKGACLD